MSVGGVPKGLLALVVDDEASVRQALRLAMEFAGWTVVEASSAGEALTAIDEQMPDLIACDKNMPGQSGIDLLRSVRERTDRVSFHLITGFGNAESAQAGMELEIDSYTQKPFKDIFRVIQHIGDAHARRQAKTAQRDDRVRGARAGDEISFRALLTIANAEARSLAAELLREVFGAGIHVEHEPTGETKGTAWDIVVTDLAQADDTLATHHAPLVVVWSAKPLRPHEMIAFADKGATGVVTRPEREALLATLEKQKAKSDKADQHREEHGIPSSLPRARDPEPSTVSKIAAAGQAKKRKPLPPPIPAAKRAPLSASLQPPVTRAPPKEHRADQAPELQALVVDDEPAIRQALRSAMELRGWVVREAESGDAGLEAARVHMPELIVCDKNMPGRSGIDLLQDIRWLSEDTSFHLLTAFANEKSAQASMVLGADSYLQKPFEDVFKLLDTIQAAHDKRLRNNDFRRERGQFGPSVRSLPPKQHESALQAVIVIKDDMMRDLAAAAVVEMAPVGTQLERWPELPKQDRVADLVICDPDVVAEVNSRFQGAEVLVWSDKTVPRELRFALANRGVRAVVAGADQQGFRDELGTIFARALTPSESVDVTDTAGSSAEVPAEAESPPQLQIDEVVQHELHRVVEGIESKTHYEVLGVPTNATKAEIRSAYFVLSKKFHPDAFFGKELGQYKKMMESVFRSATDAYETLSRKKRRAAYDRENNIVAQPRIPVPEAAQTSVPSPASKVSSDATRASKSPTHRDVSEARQRSSSGGRYRVPGSGGGRPRVVTESSPPNPESQAKNWLQQASEQEKSGDLTGAIKTLRRATARQPSMPDLQVELDRLVRDTQSKAANAGRADAMAQSEAGRWEEAAELWGGICERDPKDVSAHVEAARAIIKAERNLVDAKRYAETAIRLDEENLDAKILLAKVYSHAGMRVQARKQLKAVLAKEGSHKEASELLKELEN